MIEVWRSIFLDEAFLLSGAANAHNAPAASVVERVKSTCNVYDGKGLLDVLPHSLGACGHDVVHAALVLLHVKF